MSKPDITRMIERLRYDDHDEAANEIERLRLVEERALAAKHHDDEGFPVTMITRRQFDLLFEALEMCGNPCTVKDDLELECHLGDAGIEVEGGPLGPYRSINNERKEPCEKGDHDWTLSRSSLIRTCDHCKKEQSYWKGEWIDYLPPVIPLHQAWDSRPTECLWCGLFMRFWKSMIRCPGHQYGDQLPDKDSKAKVLERG